MLEITFKASNHYLYSVVSVSYLTSFLTTQFRKEDYNWYFNIYSGKNIFNGLVKPDRILCYAWTRTHNPLIIYTTPLQSAPSSLSFQYNISIYMRVCPYASYCPCHKWFRNVPRFNKNWNATINAKNEIQIRSQPILSLILLCPKQPKKRLHHPFSYRYLSPFVTQT